MTSLYNRRLQDIAILMCKVKFKLLPTNIISLFNASSSSYNLRKSDFFIPRFSTVRCGKHSLRYFGPLLWSKLSDKDRGLASLSTFKTNIRKKDLSSLIDDNKCTNCHLCNTWGPLYWIKAFAYLQIDRSNYYFIVTIIQRFLCYYCSFI